MENLNNFLSESDTLYNCLACQDQTKKRSLCCNQAICTDCYFEWLKYKRECMHCKKDQTDFDDWVNNYRDESVRNETDENEMENFLQTSLTLFFDEIGNLDFGSSSVEPVNANSFIDSGSLESLNDVLNFVDGLMNTVDFEQTGNLEFSTPMSYEEMETLDIDSFRELLRVFYGIQQE